MNIIKNKINDCIFTFTENTQPPFSNFILQIYSKAQNVTKSLYLPLSANTSVDINRYDRFQIEESQIEDLPNRIINLNVGQYDYKAYATSGSSITSTSGLTLVESGRINVIDDNAPQLPIYSGASYTNQVYVFK